MIPTLEQMRLISGAPPNAKTDANIQSILAGLRRQGLWAGLTMPHRLSHYLAQSGHESAGWVYDRELWGPTPAQKRYDTRTDLGNTPEVDGDGKLYMGRTGFQLTGRSNYEQFTSWCRRYVDAAAPDFVAHPDLVNTDPWEGLVPIWYWATRKLNHYADSNDIEQITKRVNGGLNGYQDRLAFYVRASLVLLGFEPSDVKGFQVAAQRKGLLPADTDDVTQIDGDPGPKTRAAMHQMLVRLSSASSSVVTAAAPVVVETEVQVPVVPEGVEKRGASRVWATIPLLGAPLSAFGGLDDTGKFIVVGLSMVGVIALLFFGERIAARAKSIIRSFEG